MTARKSRVLVAAMTRPDVERVGAQPLRVDWPVYPRRAEHNIVAEGGNRGWGRETARQNAVPIVGVRAGCRVHGPIEMPWLKQSRLRRLDSG